ncbi:transcription factor bHLH90 isoform X2 [Cicer arietinum]|uniref:Transcription factor ABORTED MICROSPORES isoform X2 n=1 Tax=Cicer arietinum TaxID=3827 RepID=A0A1S2YTU1_CICAR|nr:transcription factor ABORTED MICROSPORES isoform X2 [Cicer arietinum]
MSGMRVVEWLRPLVETKAWDYVVVWKYGNDPTRFIEWMGCCCGGGNIEHVKFEEKMDDEQYNLGPICRDTLFYHPVRTKSCEALAKFPFSISLYSSVHGEVAISQQPRWLIQQIPKDINMMEFISAHFCVSINQEAISEQSYTNRNFNDHYTLTPSIEGLSSGSNPSTEHSKGEDKEKLVREPQKEVYHAKNLVTERNRRKRINKGLFTLRSLVPNITKMDRAAILEDAIEYIKELQKQEIKLQEEVKALEVEDCEKNTLQLRVKTEKEQAKGTRSLPLIELNQSSSDSTRKTKMKLQVEVNHIGGTEFLIKLCCEQKKGGFSRLMEAIHSFGLHVVHANMITFDGIVSNNLMVEATEQDIHPMKLREYLIQQTG